MSALFAVTPGSWWFLIAVVLIFLGVVVYYTRSGSADISQHPTDGRGEAHGADAPSTISSDRGEGENPVGHGMK
jgi:hypothetical protein